jgi:hypothetical protein
MASERAALPSRRSSRTAARLRNAGAALASLDNGCFQRIAFRKVEHVIQGELRDGLGDRRASRPGCRHGGRIDPSALGRVAFLRVIGAIVHRPVSFQVEYGIRTDADPTARCRPPFPPPHRAPIFPP